MAPKVDIPVRPSPRKNSGKQKTWHCVELFAGAGGLALGAEAAGFEHLALVERDKDCAKTIRSNRIATKWPLLENDVRDVDFKQWFGKADIVCGGPPCQPFSIGGKARGATDQRDMFPEAVRAVREIQPYAFIFENVRGLLRPMFSNYVEYIRYQLTFPQVPKLPAETPEQHFHRLQKCFSQNNGPEPVYQVELTLANAADYGVPQRRHRVFFVGFRRDINGTWSFPDATHSEDALNAAKVNGAYWERHKIPKSQRPAISSKSRELFVDNKLPWITTRDALFGLGKASESNSNNHVPQPGARSYAGHTGSPLDIPAKTLKAGGHGVPGGENMVLLDDGSVRYFTVRESARIQTFPDDYVFGASWTENMRQLGNAVPQKLAQVVLSSVKESIAQAMK
jgi:DNA (cytosine-5)-methyltransferase 1